MSSETITLVISATDNASPKLKNVNDEIKNTGDESESSWGKLKNMGTAMQALAGAGIIKQFTDVVGKLNEIGVEAESTRSIFSQMTSTIGGQDAVLARLREATGNVVDDVTLMSGASSMLRMGLASNSDELARWIEGAVRLKKPTESASEAIENFSLMLSNQSVQRLDSFGISSVAVRKRMQELLDTGQALNKSEAFNMATAEQMTAGLEKMGSAAYASDTALNKLNTRIQNMTTGLGEFTARGTEAGAQLLELGATAAEMTAEGGGADFLTAVGNAISSEITGNPIDAIEEKEKAQAFVESTNTMIDAQKAFVDSTLKTSEVQKQVGNYNQDALANMNLVNDFSGTLDAANDNARRNHEEMMASRFAAQLFAHTLSTDVSSALDKAGGAWQRLVDLGMEQDAALQQQRESARLFFQDLATGAQTAVTTVENAWQTLVDAGIMNDKADKTMQAFQGGAAGFQQNFDNLTKTTIPGNGITLYDPQEVADLENDLSFVNDQVEQLTELNKAGFISDDELANAKQMAERFGVMADKASSMARSIESLSLSELLGQSGGGRLAEISDMVSQLITDAETADAFTKKSDLASGRETTASIGLKEDLAPTIAEIADELGADAAVKAMEALNNALTTGVEAGLSDQQLIDYAQQAVGYKLGPDGQLQPLPTMTPYGTPVTPTSGPFPTTSELVGMGTGMGMGMGQPAAGGEGVAPLSPTATGADQMKTTATEVSDIIAGWDAATLVTQMDTLVVQADEYATLLDKAGNGKYSATISVDVKFNYSDPKGKEMLNDEMTKIVNDNGGVLPDG